MSAVPFAVLSVALLLSEPVFLRVFRDGSVREEIHFVFFCIPIPKKKKKKKKRGFLRFSPEPKRIPRAVHFLLTTATVSVFLPDASEQKPDLFPLLFGAVPALFSTLLAWASVRADGFSYRSEPLTRCEWEITVGTSLVFWIAAFLAMRPFHFAFRKEVRANGR